MTVETEQGDEVGVLEAILEIPDNQIFVVRKGTKEILIPAAKSFVTSVDLAAPPDDGSRDRRLG